MLAGRYMIYDDCSLLQSELLNPLPIKYLDVEST